MGIVGKSSGINYARLVLKWICEWIFSSSVILTSLFDVLLQGFVLSSASVVQVFPKLSKRLLQEKPAADTAS